MKKLFLSIVALYALFGVETSFGWGQKGHDVIAYIAECHLTPKARKAVDRALNGQSMMYYSSWMDNIRNLPEYAETSTWHYANVDEGQTYETMKKEPRGDVYTALTMVVDQLSNHKQLNDSLENLYIKYLVHLVGDLHCPMHAGRLSDLGGNQFKIFWFNTPTNLHSIWDSSFIESARKWSYTEWRRNIDYLDKKEIADICHGSLLDWLNETVVICKGIYMNAEEGANYSWDYMYNNFPTLESQLRKAGYRLAYLLNNIYK